MNFSEAYKLMQEGKKVKLPSWGGYWELENNTIMMHCKNGDVIDMFDSDDKLYTLSNIASNEWIEADETNTPILGGCITLTFTQAVKYLTQGKKMRRKSQEYEIIYSVGDNIYCHDLTEGKDFSTSMDLLYMPTMEDLTSTDWEFYNEEE